ncbi:MAG: hypothetical protein RSC92_05600, partial [Clostridia bacterium]
MEFKIIFENNTDHKTTYGLCLLKSADFNIYKCVNVDINETIIETDKCFIIGKKENIDLSKDPHILRSNILYELKKIHRLKNILVEISRFCSNSYNKNDIFSNISYVKFVLNEYSDYICTDNNINYSCVELL